MVITGLKYSFWGTWNVRSYWKGPDGRDNIAGIGDIGANITTADEQITKYLIQGVIVRSKSPMVAILKFLPLVSVIRIEIRIWRNTVYIITRW